MKVVVIGASGQLGSDLMKAFEAEAPIGVDHRMVDIEAPAAVAKMLQHYEPDLVINTAAYHNVEACETYPERAFAVNALSVDRLALQCASAGSAFAHISTDYVFDGNAAVPYAESVVPNPINAYGISKVAGELLVKRGLERYFIFRTSGLYGIRGSSSKGYTFIERILAQAAEGRELRVVTDITFSPSYTRHVADAIRAIVASGAYGTYHVTNAGACTWHAFAVEILDQAGITADVAETVSSAFPSLARRPAYSALQAAGMERLGLPALPPWKDGIRAYLAERRLSGAPRSA